MKKSQFEKLGKVEAGEIELLESKLNSRFPAWFKEMLSEYSGASLPPNSFLVRGCDDNSLRYIIHPREVTKELEYLSLNGVRREDAIPFALIEGEGYLALCPTKYDVIYVGPNSNWECERIANDFDELIGLIRLIDPNEIEPDVESVWVDKSFTPEF